MNNTEISENVILDACNMIETPFLCFESNEIEKWSTLLRKSIPPEAAILYSVKAGPNPYLIKALQKKKFLFETASEGELLYLLKLGIEASEIWASGQGKTEKYFKSALEAGVYQFNLESLNELKLLYSLKKDDISYKCNIRVNPEFSSNGSVLKMGGVPSAFGIDEAAVLSIFSEDYGEFVNGLMMYAGSQYFDEADIIHNTKYLLDLASYIYEKTGKCFETLDFGGGFGVPESDEDGELDLANLQKGLTELFGIYLQKEEFKKVKKLIFESGRFISARTAYLVTKVLDIKQSKGKYFLITDGGLNCLGVKQMEYRIHPPFIKHISISNAQDDSLEEYRIVGNTCTPIDLTHPGCLLKKPQQGDLICIPDCGAYSVTFSPNNFCGQVKPAELVHINNKFIITNKSESALDAYCKNLIDFQI